MTPKDEGRDAFSYVRDWRRAFQQSGWWHSFELPGGEILEGVSKLDAQKRRIAQFPIPDDLTGKRVLDIGTWDGWFAMEMERRGAEVVAIDRWENPRFYEIHRLLKSRVDYRQLSVYDLDPDRIGRFDVVLFMGVLYHLKHPLLALERVCSVAKDLVAVESFTLRDRHRPGLGVEAHTLMEFYEGTEFGGEFDNWVAPTVPCLMAFCRTAGFVRVELNNVHDFGAAITCHRTWDRPSGEGCMKLLAAFHTDSGGINFNSRSSDDYVGCRVDPQGATLTPDAVWPEVGGYAAAPVFAGPVEGIYQVNFKLPPGLPSGWHEVRLRTADAVSNAVEIAVDVPVSAGSLRIRSVCDGVTWTPYRVSREPGFASIWVEGLPRNADRNNVVVRIADRRQFPTFVGAPGADGATQVNVRLSPGTPPGAHQVEVECGGASAPPAPIEVAQ